MLSIMFWNTMKRDLRLLIAKLAASKSANIVILAESSIKSADLELLLLKITKKVFRNISKQDEKIQIFTSLDANKWSRAFLDLSSSRVSYWALDYGPSPGILLISPHLLSKLHADTYEQALSASHFANNIAMAETNVKHDRTILVGDFNMNPHEAGMIGTTSLHAVMDRNLARKLSRKYQGKTCKFFFNPMWCHYGDGTDGPCGTYFHRSAGGVDHYWHMLDQVIVRPSLMDSLSNLEIVHQIDGESIVTRDLFRPNNRKGSDHLPISFRLFDDRGDDHERD